MPSWISWAPRIRHDDRISRRWRWCDHDPSGLEVVVDRYTVRLAAGFDTEGLHQVGDSRSPARFGGALKVHVVRPEDARCGEAEQFRGAGDVVRRVAVTRVSEVGGEHRKLRLDIDAITIPGRQAQSREAMAQVMRPQGPEAVSVEARACTRFAEATAEA